MPTVDYNRFKDTASDMIEKWGMTAVLRRVGMADRTCTVVITNFSPMERAGNMRNPLDRKALVSARGLTVPPDPDRDRLITFVQPDGTVEDEALKIVETPYRVDMAGKVVYYKLAVRK